ncbi:MAG: hypothetical protein JJE30_01345 [Desulfuromonadales bacterium]|nr:hypothetical protein [Desulfuromonadales bacterium]
MDFSVSVTRDDLDSALKLIKKNNKGKKPFDLTLEFCGSTLRLESLFATVEIQVTGRAIASITLPGQIMLRLRETFPNKNPLQVSLSGTTLKIESLSMPCRVNA